MNHDLVSLSDIADITNGFFVSSSKLVSSDDGVPILSVRSLTGASIDLSNLDYAPAEELDLHRHGVELGDVLVSARSTSVSTGIVPPEIGLAAFNSTLIGIRIRDKLIHPRLLVAWMQSGLGQSHFETLSQSTTLQMNITVKELSTLPVPIFSPAEQAALVAALEASDVAYQNAIKAAYQRQSIALQLVTDVLTGKTKIKHG